MARIHAVQLLYPLPLLFLRETRVTLYGSSEQFNVVCQLVEPLSLGYVSSHLRVLGRVMSAELVSIVVIAFSVGFTVEVVYPFTLSFSLVHPATPCFCFLCSASLASSRAIQFAMMFTISSRLIPCPFESIKLTLARR